MVLTLFTVRSQNYQLTFSTQRGFYQENFTLTVNSNSDESIIYTIDGSDPRFSESAQISSSPVTITIDPENTSGRYTAPGFVVRACIVAASVPPQCVYTQTYLFNNQIIALSLDGERPDEGWPQPNNSDWSRQFMDYGLDPDVCNDPRYNSKMEEAFLDIPSISLVTDLWNLFDPDSGIYANAFGRGIEWERPGSMEILNPDGKPNIQINCGIRIRGGWSRHADNPKHAFRLFFREEYGASKLIYHLFVQEGPNEFDKIDLRTSQNYSWAFKGGGDDSGEHNTMLRDVFSRDLQGKMNMPYTRSRYYHLYLNGVYWGLFQTQERVDDSFAETYFGGATEDYDVIKKDPEDYRIEANKGTLEAYNSLWEIAGRGFSTADDYYLVQGLNPDGSRNPDYPILVDLNNLICYMLGIYYSGNFDCPVSAFISPANTKINNIFAIYNRVNPTGFKFFQHDAEHTLFLDEGGIPGAGIDRTGPYMVDTPPPPEQFNPQWLHQQLTNRLEYRIKFSDYVYKFFYNDGILTPAKVIALIQERKNQIDKAIIAESARWGDAKVSTPRTYDDDWLPAVNFIINDYAPIRTSMVIDQFKNQGWYPSIDPPTFNLQDGLVNQGTSLTLASGQGTIYYTIDGSDPFQPGSFTQNSIPLVTKSSSKRVLVPDGDLGTDWRTSLGYNDSSWPIASGTQGGIGYENESGYESYIDYDLTDLMYNINTSCYVRIKFNLTAEQLAEIQSLQLKMLFDDGFIAYLNGTKVAEYLAPSTPQWNSAATENHEAGSLAENFNISAFINTLVAGENILAIQGLNVSTTSSDFLILPELIASDNSAGENISPSAITYTTPIVINNSITIRTRALNGSEWSALNEIHLWVADGYNTLKVTEIHYHPLGEEEIDDSEFEFLELKNVGSSPIVLDNAYFSRGINYTFPASTVLNAGEFIVLVSNFTNFYSRYQITPFGEYTGNLNNGGETISFNSAAGDTVIKIEYDDIYPWPVSPDGVGYSLVPKIINRLEDQNDPFNWRPSWGVHGSPGADTSTYSEPPVNDIKEIKPAIPLKFQLFQNYPNPFNTSTTIRFNIEKTTKVSLKIYNILGQETATLIYNTLQTGKYTVNWDATGYSSGIYFCRLLTKEFCQTKKIILLK